MPGAPLLYVSDSYQGASGEGVPSGAPGAPATGLGWSFFIWLVVIGILIPVGVLGALHVGGYSFTYKRR